ncbi:MAG: flagellar assembly protein A [Sulfuricurvum sp.]|uniref:flagellar assembly protein A n=2 Tax=Sulfuricurvum sp. TaxID=2025608 RepID=UPI003D0BAE2C
MFTPINKTSTNVMSDLLTIAKDRGVAVDELDFDLLTYETYYKGTVDDEWQYLEGDNLLEQTTEIEIRSKLFLLRQEYQIHIRSFSPHPYLDLRFSIATDKYKSKAVAIIDPKSTIPLKKGVQKWIKEAIVRKQLRHGLMIGIFSTHLDQEINRFLLKIQKEGALSAPYRLPIAELFPPVPPTNDKIILHYKELNKSNSLIEGVHPDDLILEYVFAKHGRDGRACDGNHILVPEPVIRYAGQLVVDEESVKAEEDEESIRFYAKKSGFVQRKKGVFLIAQELQIDTASFKKTGSIEAGVDKEISLKIKKKVAVEDSIGTGVNIDVQKLDVSGTVGGNAKIQACEVTIGAQTHRHSKINVTEAANIHLHRGNLKAKEAIIEILETGKVEADTVRVSKMVGGEIIARTVYIDTLYSNARITALESIEIQTIEGEGNNLVIDPHALESYHEKIEALKIDIRAKTSRLQEQSKELIARQISFKEKHSRIKQFQQRLIEAKKNGTEPSKADVIRVMQFKAESEDLKKFSDTLQEAEAHLHALNEELNKLYEADLHAVVIHHGVYNGHNRIIFIDPKTHQNYAVTPNTQVTTVRLIREGEDKRLLLES